jgi:hypothetical protein
MFAIAVPILVFVMASNAQTKSEMDARKQDLGPLEATSCKEVTRLLNSERGELVERPIRFGLGWWGRGFVTGAVYILGTKRAEEKARAFGLSVEVVAAHLATYCHDHPTETPMAGVLDLLENVVR